MLLSGQGKEQRHKAIGYWSLSFRQSAFYEPANLAVHGKGENPGTCLAVVPAVFPAISRAKGIFRHGRMPQGRLAGH